MTASLVRSCQTKEFCLMGSWNGLFELSWVLVLKLIMFVKIMKTTVSQSLECSVFAFGSVDFRYGLLINP